MSKKMILVIDDEKGVLESFKTCLEDEYIVATTKTGEEGIELIKKILPDLVFLDMRLPGIDGLATLEIIKTINKNIPVVIITCVETIKTAVESMRLGVHEYFLKPFNANDINTLVTAVFSKENAPIENSVPAIVNHPYGNLPVDIEGFIEETKGKLLCDNVSLDRAVSDFSGKLMRMTLHKTNGNTEKAAELLGIKQSRLRDI